MRKGLYIFVYFLFSLHLYADQKVAFDWNNREHIFEKVTPGNTQCDRSENIADLVERLIPAFVNISSEYRQEDNGRTVAPLFPRDDFFRKFFEEFDQFIERGPRVNREMISLGSGFFIDGNGTIVTNYHVIKNAKEITVTVSDNTYLKAEILGYDARTDLAVLKVQAEKPFSYVRFGDSDKTRIGDSVIAIGNPFGLGSSVSKGIISAKSRDISIGTVNEFIQTDAAINRGNSGGPLFNLKGEVVGINTAMVSPSESHGNVGVGFAIPSNVATSIIETLQKGKKVEHGYFGVEVQSITKEFARSLGLKEHRGALVSNVIKDTPADKAGIKVSDVILEFNGKRIDRMAQLPQVVSRTEPGTKVQVKLLRKGREVIINVKVGALPDDKDNNTMNQDNDKSEYDIIGFTVANLSRERMMDNHLQGVVVDRVNSNSNAAFRGIRTGDIIMQVNGNDISNTDDFQKQVGLAIKDKKGIIMLLVYKNGIQSFISVKLQQ